MLFPFFQLTRPPRLKAITMWDRWFFVNFACAVAYDVGVVYFCGWPGFLYLVFSFFFSIGLHPVGARWIQEHYTNDPEQETYSYYGPINRLALNMGYHNEHHDLPSIPWNNLPKLRAMAPEFYNNLKYHSSWSRLLFAVHLRQKVQPVFSNRESEAAATTKRHPLRLCSGQRLRVALNAETFTF